MDGATPESIDTLPDLCGSESRIADATRDVGPFFLADSDIDFSRVRCAFAIALHMHQPLIPAGGADPRSAAIVGNLQFMLEHPEIPDAHNAPAFLWCYKRMGQLIPDLVREGKSPRVLLDYSGCLLHGLAQMGATDVIDALRPLAIDPAYRRCVEWVGTAWGHAVAPSTPPPDFRLHVLAWQHHFASVFGLEALGRVKGFSPPEMALPNHPDDCYEFVRTLKECGYRWVLVQEHSVEPAGRADDGSPINRLEFPHVPHLPHRLLVRNSLGQSLQIVAILKTQGSDTKLVGQMQPYYEARGLSPVRLSDKPLPPLVAQIGDGENGGVMMNEFPPKFLQVMREASGSDTPPMGVTEYLEHLSAAGAREDDFPAVRPLFHQRIWDRFEDGAGPAKLEAAIEGLRREDDRFHVEGGSWTADRSWVRGYESLTRPMESASAGFHDAVRQLRLPTSDPRYRLALFHLLLCQTSCFRYWGQGPWTELGRELCRRAVIADDP